MAAINLGARFLLELAMLGSLGYWGFVAGESWPARILLGLGAPVAALVLWGLFIAPKASRLLPDPARLGLEAVLFVGAVVALLAADRREWAVVLAIAVVVNIALMFMFDQRRGRTTGVA